VLSKADLCDNIGETIEERTSAVEAIAPGVPIHVISTMQQSGMADLKQYIEEGRTVALVGSSGAGKSTLLNYFAGCDVMKVQSIRGSDDKGKHTSTHRELFLLPDTGLMIDTPGMRELQLWNGSEGLSETFSDIESIAKTQKAIYKNARSKNYNEQGI
jgi:ribosome biogenesis GTPase